jgi:(p)ppGpp synthase/HD superfamily hydrolase
MHLTPRFQHAVGLAAEVHAGQTRKGTKVPYMAHLLGVASIVFTYLGDEDEGIGALLHDAIEDAKPPLRAAIVRSRIREMFGQRVLDIVEGCTDSDETPKPPWLERKKAYLARVGHESASVILVSAADKLHNATSVLADFRTHGDELWSRFNPEAGKAGSIGYYRALASAFTATGHHPELIGALDAVVSELEDVTGHKGRWPPR